MTFSGALNLEYPFCDYKKITEYKTFVAENENNTYSTGFESQGKWELIKNEDIINLETNPVFIESNLKTKIMNVFYPEEWLNENIAKPSVSCREETIIIGLYLYKELGIYPDRIGANVEEGITLYYKNFKDNKELIIEIYNTLEIAALLNQNSNIIRSYDIDGIDDENLTKIVKLFKTQIS